MTYDQALSRAASLCATAERCPSDIHSKALSWGLSEDEVARLVAHLVQEKFLDEARYAHAFANDKSRFQHWGRTKIRYALRAKGISDTVINTALDSVIDDTEAYLDQCVTLLQGRMRGMSLPLSPQDRARLYRFAAQRGFESDIILRAVDRLLS